ncbi:MAG: hypothetical protein HYY05_00730 [Chloroflexi bacterium]|nr:hypothetical protein [Chloroflexota bacterium]
MSDTHSRNGHEPSPLVPPGATDRAVSAEVLGRVLRPAGGGFRGWAILLAILLAVGIVGFLLRLQGGVADRAQWGYTAALFAILLSTFQAAPLVSITQRFLRSQWRRPLARAMELLAVVGLLNFLIMLPVVAALPPLEGRASLWNAWPGAPHLWDTLGVALLVVAGLAVLYVGALPDLAALAVEGQGWRAGLWRRLAGFWVGTPHQWVSQRMALGALGMFYFLMLVFAHSMVAMDFSMALIPGWKSAIFPAFHALSALQSGLATAIVTLFILRTIGGWREYLHVDQFWSLAKLLLSFSLLWFYFWYSEFIILWYGRQPQEESAIGVLMTGPYMVPFVVAFLCSFVLPLGLLIWNPIRRSIRGPMVVACIILVGQLFDRVRLYVSAYSVEQVGGHVLEQVPAFRAPDLVDVMILVGGVAGAVLLVLLAGRLVPVFSLWELKEGMMLRKVVPIVRLRLAALAKPR